MNEIVWGIVAGTLLIFLLVAIVILTFFFAKRERVKQEKLFAEAQLQFEQEMRTMESEVQEELMSSIANELHDDAGQLLTAMQIEIHNQNADHPENAENYKQVESYLVEVTQKLRRLGKSLNTDFIKDGGIVSAIQVESDRTNSLRRFQIQLDLPTEASTLEKDQELILFRIFQEIIQNGLKHSRAENLFVKLRFQPFLFHVEDDGVGFDYKSIVENNLASGLRNIKKRANLAKFECQIESKPDEGTKFIFKRQEKKLKTT